MRRFMRSLRLALVIVTGLVWSSAQTTTPNAPTYPATTAAVTPDAGQPATNPLPTAQDSGVRQVTVPAGTEVLLSLKNTIDTKSARPGDEVYCQTTFPVVIDNVTVIPPGTYVKGEIARVQRAGIIKGRAEVLLRFQTVIFPNGTVQMAGTLYGDPGTRGAKTDQEGSVKTDTHDKLKKAPAAALGGALLGSSVGTIISGGTPKGAGIGAGIGAAVLLAPVLLTRGPDVRIEPGAAFTMKLESPLVVDVTPSRSVQAGSQWVPRPTENRLPLPTTNKDNE
jgi:hypothetical protein